MCEGDIGGGDCGGDCGDCGDCNDCGDCGDCGACCNECCCLGDCKECCCFSCEDGCDLAKLCEGICDCWCHFLCCSDTGNGPDDVCACGPEFQAGHIEGDAQPQGGTCCDTNSCILWYLCWDDCYCHCGNCSERRKQKKAKPNNNLGVNNTNEVDTIDPTPVRKFSTLTQDEWDKMAREELRKGLSPEQVQPPPYNSVQPKRMTSDL
eukprot:m.89125 g.89125  ORF g.89125 m.89125 type:complete len:207 (-) comp13206_c0_seq1:261-881(-)